MKIRMMKNEKKCFLFFHTVLLLFLFSLPIDARAFDAVTCGQITPDQSRLWSPGRLAMDDEGTIYVVDGYKNRVQLFTAKGAPVGSIPVVRPAAVAASGDGTLYIGSHADYSVAIYRRSEVIGRLGSGKNEFGSIGDIAVDKNSGDVYVSDVKGNSIRVYDATGSPKRKIGGLNAPTSVAVSDTAVVVLDSPAVACPATIMVNGLEMACTECTDPCTGSRITILDKSGAVIRQTTESGTKSDNMVRPVALAVDASGAIYAADSLKQAILVYDQQLSYVGRFVSPDGRLHAPVALTLSRDNNLYASSSETRSIVEMGLGGTLHSLETGIFNFEPKTGAASSTGAGN